MKRRFLKYQVKVEGINATLFEDENTKINILTKLDKMNKEYGYEDVYANDKNEVFISGDIVQDTKPECKAIYTLAKRDILSILKEYGATKVSMNMEGYGDVLV